MNFFQNSNVPKKGVRDVMDSIRLDEGFRERFLAIFPDAQDNVTRLIADPECRCRAKILALLATYQGDVDDLAMQLWEAPVMLILPRSIAGEHCDIPDDMNLYKSVIKQCEIYGLAYRGISVIPGTGQDQRRWMRILFW